MVLVDTSVWISHFKNTQPKLIELLNQDLVSCHPLVIAEIACGTPPNPRARTLEDLSLLNQCKVATLEEVLSTIERYNLSGRGCGYIDIALLASALITDNTKLWTLDKRLNLLAKQFDRSFLIE
jgi:predicted nucleic acid-binding protein